MAEATREELAYRDDTVARLVQLARMDRDHGQEVEFQLLNDAVSSAIDTKKLREKLYALLRKESDQLERRLFAVRQDLSNLRVEGRKLELTLDAVDSIAMTELELRDEANW